MAFEKAVQNKYFIGTVQNVCPATTRAIAAQTHECQLFQKPMLLLARPSVALCIWWRRFTTRFSSCACIPFLLNFILHHYQQYACKQQPTVSGF